MAPASPSQPRIFGYRRKVITNGCSQALREQLVDIEDYATELGLEIAYDAFLAKKDGSDTERGK